MRFTLDGMETVTPSPDTPQCRTHDLMLNEGPLLCCFCNTHLKPESTECTEVYSNVRAFRYEKFSVWRCQKCRSIHAQNEVDLNRYYSGYPIQNQKDTLILHAAMRVRLNRLVRSGLKKTDAILDFGCGSGSFVHYLLQKGYHRAIGFDPHSPSYSDISVLKTHGYNFILSQDVIEHDTDPATHLQHITQYLAPGGTVCVGTTDASKIDFSRKDDRIGVLHQPHHRHIPSMEGLVQLAETRGYRLTCHYPHWYFHSLLPGCNTRFLLAYLSEAGDFDAAFEPPRIGMVLRTPRLMWLYFFGYFCTDNQMTLFFNLKS